MSQVTKCDRCGHDKEYTGNANSIDEAWTNMVTTLDPVTHSVYSSVHRDLCPWCRTKFIEFLESYDPNET